MKRKVFLKTVLPLAAIPVALTSCKFKKGGFLDAVFGSNVHDNRILVLVQLQGGNDGLSTIIPLDQYTNLSAARKNILIPENKVLPLNGTSVTGFHPAMADLQNMYNRKELTFIQGVSYPNPNLSHFRATDIWLTGSDTNTVLNSGWLGRYLDKKYPGYPGGYPNAQTPEPPAIQIGNMLSGALQGKAMGLGISVINTMSFYDMVLGKQAVAQSTRAGRELDFMRMAANQTQQYTSVIKAAALAQKNLSERYPSNGKNAIADQLKIVAQLIGGGLKTKIYMVTLDGFDTHGNQANPSNTIKGRHAELLGQLSTAIAAFEDDLKLMGKHDNVLGMTFSEFGRRIHSNASNGTDHGTSGPVILFGSKLKGGFVGSNPQIEAKVKPEDNLSMQHDFRSVYASVLKGWFGLTDEELKNTLLSTCPVLDLFTSKS